MFEAVRAGEWNARDDAIGLRTSAPATEQVIRAGTSNPALQNKGAARSL
jgi:hypothetical protein